MKSPVTHYALEKRFAKQISLGTDVYTLNRIPYNIPTPQREIIFHFVQLWVRNAQCHRRQGEYDNHVE